MEEKITKLLEQVADACEQTLHSLRNTPEEKWSDEDQGVFHLSGSYLLLYNNKDLDKLEVQQLLLASATACGATLKHYQNVPAAQWDEFDKVMNLMCRAYLVLFNQAVKDKKIVSPNKEKMN